MIRESFLITEGSQVGSRVDPGDAANSLQIALLSDPTEHLRQTEGLHGAGAVWSTESRWKRGHSRSRCLRPPILGTVTMAALPATRDG
jgi:hypothetical protein